MHDGSVATLEAAIDHYAAGGRAPDNPNKSSTLRGFRLTKSEQGDLVKFLKSLTDEELLTDPRWSSPWRRR
jgi:cytochrome c peroxidase